MLETIKKSVEETDARVRDILDFIKSDYPKASSQKEHEHNIEIVDYAVNQCKYGLKEKLRQSFNQALLTTHLSLIESLIDELEGKKKGDDCHCGHPITSHEYVPEFSSIKSHKGRCVHCECKTYKNSSKDFALTDTITTLQALREEITSLIK